MFRSILPLCISVIVILTGCTTTRFEPTIPCATRLQNGSKVLLFSLPPEDEEFLTKQIKSILDDKNVVVDYLPEQEWNLRAKGINKLEDSVDIAKLHSIGYSHILRFREISSRGESFLAYYTPLEVSLKDIPGGYKPTDSERGNQSKVIVELIPTIDPIATHSAIAQTTIGHLTVRHDDGGETYVNPTDTRNARNIAFLKSLKKISEDCYR